MEQIRKEVHDAVRFLRWAVVILLIILASLLPTLKYSRETNNIARNVTGKSASQAQTLIVAKLLSAECRTRYYAEAETGNIDEYVKACLGLELRDRPILPTTIPVPRDPGTTAP